MESVLLRTILGASIKTCMKAMYIVNFCILNLIFIDIIKSDVKI